MIAPRRRRRACADADPCWQIEFVARMDDDTILHPPDLLSKLRGADPRCLLVAASFPHWYTLRPAHPEHADHLPHSAAVLRIRQVLVEHTHLLLGVLRLLAGPAAQGSARSKAELRSVRRRRRRRSVSLPARRNLGPISDRSRESLGPTSARCVPSRCRRVRAVLSSGCGGARLVRGQI